VKEALQAQDTPRQAPAISGGRAGREVHPWFGEAAKMAERKSGSSPGRPVDLEVAGAWRASSARWRFSGLAA
jgi:hypothetical protein